MSKFKLPSLGVTDHINSFLNRLSKPSQKPFKERWTFLYLFLLWEFAQKSILFSMSLTGHFKVYRTLIYLVILIACLFLSYKLSVSRKLMPKVGRTQFPIKKICVAFGLMLVIGMISGLVMKLTGTSGTDNQDAIIAFKKIVPIAAFIAMTLSSAVFEELIFRVTVFEYFLTKWPKVAAVVSCVLFTMLHSTENISAIVFYGLMSILLTGLYMKYRNFYLNMSVHLLWNVLCLIPFFI